MGRICTTELTLTKGTDPSEMLMPMRTLDAKGRLTTAALYANLDLTISTAP